MLSSAMYGRLLNPPAIQPFTCAAYDVVGVENADADISGYVDEPVDIVGVIFHHSLLMMESFAFFFVI